MKIRIDIRQSHNNKIYIITHSDHSTRCSYHGVNIRCVLSAGGTDTVLSFVLNKCGRWCLMMNGQTGGRQQTRKFNCKKKK